MSRAVSWRAYWVDAEGVVRYLCGWSSYSYANGVGLANPKKGAMLIHTTYPGCEPEVRRPR